MDFGIKIKNFMSREYSRTKCRYLDITIAISFVLVLLIVVLNKAIHVCEFESVILRSWFYPMLSIFANLLVWKMIQMVFAVKNIRLKKEHFIYIVCSFFAFFIIYFIWLNKVDFLYYWDFSCYMVKQRYAELAFSTGITEGLQRLI